MASKEEEEELRSVTLQNAQSIFRERVEEELLSARHDLEETADALRTHSEWLRITLASISDGVITTDRAGFITSLNPVAETITGWTQAEAEGRALDEVFRILDEASRAPVANPVMRALQEGRAVSLPKHALLQVKDGTECVIEDSIAPIRDEGGSILGAVLIFRDSTEQRRANAALQHLAAVVASSADAIITKDLNGRITTWNDGARQIFGYTAEEVVGKSITILIPPEMHAEEDDILARLRRGERVMPFETVRIDKAGRRLDISVTASPIRDPSGRVIGASKYGSAGTRRRAAG